LIFDTMVLAYSLLKAPGFHEGAAAALAKADEVVAPDLLPAELVNVVWQWVRARRLSLERGLQILDEGERLMTRLVPARMVWDRALRLSVSANHPAYDTLFVALAIQTGTRLVTYDRRLQKLFPEYVISVPEYLRENPQGRGNFRPSQSY